ncbi:HIR complex subunit [Tulasnella sp. 408]|nr:HIR complex subunit [Tulasnella sp. 408]
MHSGPVLCVRWSSSGKWLASGSDDAIVMIWDLDPAGAGRVWGSDDANVEGWKALKRLPGHDSDVTDLAWSPKDRFLASVGLDNKVIIWCGYTLEPLRKLDLHQGFVKGVCWDPVGEFLATQSDDKSVKVWRTTDWGLEATITKPFEDSPGSTFFRRLSWSPDGAHITASNAMNNNGYVFVAAVIARNEWTSDICLVGHENTVEVASYNPHIFLRDPKGDVQSANICSVVALGADDLSVSIWQTKSPRPLIVARDCFESQIFDLSWSKDGLTLYGCSADGSLGVFDFDPAELDGIVSLEEKELYLKRFGFQPPPDPFAMGVQRPQTSYQQPGNPYAGQGLPPAPPSAAAQAAAAAAMDPGPAFDKKGRKRIRPVFVGALNSAPGAFPTSSAPHHYDVDGDRMMGGYTNGMAPPKRKLSEMEDDSSALNGGFRAPKARTLGGDRPRDPIGPVRELRPATQGFGYPPPPMKIKLDVPPLLSYLSVKSEEREGDVFEAKNPEPSQDPSKRTEPFEVALLRNKETVFLDYPSAPVLSLAVTSAFCAAGLEGGSLNVYSPNGRRLLPTIALDSSCTFLAGSKNSLMAITASGKLHVWNVKTQKASFAPVSLDTLITPNATITSAVVRPNGCPIITLSSGIVYSYDVDLACFTKLSEARWAQGSDVWEGRQRERATKAPISRGPVATMECELPGEMQDSASPTPYWRAAFTLGHLEAKLHAAEVLDSPQEYKTALLAYAKRLADEGYRAKAEELIKELFGPLYWYVPASPYPSVQKRLIPLWRRRKPGKEETWCPTVLGMQKRDLLREVLPIFVKSKTLAKLGQDWQDTLRRALSE